LSSIDNSCGITIVAIYLLPLNQPVAVQQSFRIKKPERHQYSTNPESNTSKHRRPKLSKCKLGKLQPREVYSYFSSAYKAEKASYRRK